MLLKLYICMHWNPSSFMLGPPWSQLPLPSGNCHSQLGRVPHANRTYFAFSCTNDSSSLQEFSVISVDVLANVTNPQFHHLAPINVSFSALYYWSYLSSFHCYPSSSSQSLSFPHSPSSAGPPYRLRTSFGPSILRVIFLIPSYASFFLALR